MARRFAEKLVYETEMERLFRQFARSSAESAKQLAEEISDDRKLFKPRGRSEDIDPDIFGPSKRAFGDLMIEFKQRMLMDQAILKARQANEELDRAEASAKRIAYFSSLQRKYERAANYPWLPIETDPPEPPEPK